MAGSFHVGSTAYTSRDGAHEAVLEFLAELYGSGGIDSVERDELEELAHQAYEAADQWDLWSEEGGIEEARAFYEGLYEGIAARAPLPAGELDFLAVVDSALGATGSQLEREGAEDLATMYGEATVQTAVDVGELGAAAGDVGVSLATDWRYQVAAGAAGLLALVLWLKVKP